MECERYRRKVRQKNNEKEDSEEFDIEIIFSRQKKLRNDQIYLKDCLISTRRDLDNSEFYWVWCEGLNIPLNQLGST